MSFCDGIRIENGYSKDAYTYYPVVIIGAGESGLAMGCRLKDKFGFDQFRIFDRQSAIGGTWWINRYPGVACDVPSALYSYSFAPHYTSESLYPTGAEFAKYLRQVAARYKIVDKIQLNTDVTELRHVESDGQWDVTLSHLVLGMGDLSEAQRQDSAAACGERCVYIRREKVRAKVVISCVGILVEPKPWPKSIPGREIFQGDVLHSARWQDDLDFNNKDIIVVGAGCSAAQIIPSLLTEKFNVKSVTQLIRSAPWVMPRLTEPFGKKAYAQYAPTVFRYFPFLGYAFRVSLYLLVEAIWLTVFQQKNVKWRAIMESKTLERMHSTIPKEYHAIMTPNFAYGGKRRIFDSAWLESMSKPNFHLTARPLKRLEAQGAVLGPQPSQLQERESNKSKEDIFVHADIVILANGFEATHWLHPLAVFGRDGRSIHDIWDQRGGPQAYMGTAVDGFPNFFMTTGPNTANGHGSLILTSENMTEYILKIIEPVLAGDAPYVEARNDAEIKWTNRIQKELTKTVFHGCRSWYQDKTGWNSTMYPRSQTDFTMRCMFPKYNDWEIAYTQRGNRRRRYRKAFRAMCYIIPTALALAVVMTSEPWPGLAEVVLNILTKSVEAIKYIVRRLCTVN